MKPEIREFDKTLEVLDQLIESSHRRYEQVSLPDVDRNLLNIGLAMGHYVCRSVRQLLPTPQPLLTMLLLVRPYCEVSAKLLWAAHAPDGFKRLWHRNEVELIEDAKKSIARIGPTPAFVKQAATAFTFPEATNLPPAPGNVMNLFDDLYKNLAASGKTYPVKVHEQEYQMLMPRLHSIQHGDFGVYQMLLGVVPNKDPKFFDAHQVDFVLPTTWLLRAVSKACNLDDGEATLALVRYKEVQDASANR